MDSFIFVSNSLGGALATLFSFRLAGSDGMEKKGIPFPLICMTYASPYVGDSNFRKAFEQLETKGRLRHIRVSNQNDAVPVLPPGGYQHTGINLHLKDQKKENEPPFAIGYSEEHGNSWFSQISPLFYPSHRLPNYWSRTKAVEDWYMNGLKEEKFEPMNIENMYQNIDTF